MRENRNESKELGENSGTRSYTVYVPPKFPLNAASFAQGTAEFVHFFICDVLPGK